MHNSRINRISLAVCFALLPMAASAAGLGKLTVISGLGEPLNAEVELSASQDELSSISAQIASADVFAEQGIERASALSGVRIEIGKRPDGVPVLRLKSAQPISDPFLDMLIQVEWSSGRLLREYTALLDPPGYGEPAGVVSPVATVPSELPGTASSTTATGKAKSRKDAAVSIAEAAADGEIVVQKGDTLSALAVANAVDGVSLEQMLVGLYRANENAFAGANMNRLKVGQIIRVPSQEELQALPQQEAQKEIRIQTADWNAYRNKLSGMVAESAPAQEAPSAQVATGKIAAPAEDKSAMEPAGPRDVVRLSKSEAGDVNSRLIALQEEAIAREKSVKESSERVAALEKQLQDMQKLLEIKNKSLADAQMAGKEPPPPPPVVAPEPAPVEPAKVEPPVTEPTPAAEQTPEPAAEKPAKKPKKIVRPSPPPPPESGLFDGLAGNPLLLAGGGGLLALIGGAWFYMRNKRRKGLDSFEQGILTTGGLKPNTVFGNTAGGTVDTGNTSFLTDFGQGTAAGMIDTNEVDPIAEAEVYMAYGRDVQAEEILKDAIAKEPKRHELHLKLLEIFAARKDSGAFETLAGEIYATLGATDPIWPKVAEMGHRLEPDNPLYGDGGAHTGAAAELPEPVAFDAMMIQQPPAGDEGAAGLDIGLGGPDTTLDFSLDEPALSEPEAAKDEGNALDFDIGTLELPSAEPATEVSDLDAAPELDLPMLGEEPSAAEASALAEPAGLDFPLDLPEAAVETNAQLDVADLGLDALSGLETSQKEESIELSLDLPALDSVESTEAAALDLSSLDMVAPEAVATEVISLDEIAEPEVVVAKDEIALDLELPELDTTTSSIVEASPEEVSLELPEEEVAALDIDIGAEKKPASETVETTGLDETLILDLPSTEGFEAKAAEEETEAASELDFNFEVDLGEPVVAPAASVPDIDLTGISLDIGDVSAAAEMPAEEITLEASNESPDVDTKLDLVTAYIDMGDQEGARELLLEVMQEGGPAQRGKAQKLLDSLG